jgi:hypothetical protein
MSKVCAKCGIEKDEGEFTKGSNCKACLAAWQREYRKTHGELVRASLRKSYQKYKEERLQGKREYYQANRDDICRKVCERAKTSREKINTYARRYHKERRVKDRLFYLSCLSRTLIRGALKRKGFTKKSKTADLLGCSFEDFMTHLGNPPCDTPHLDHICPVAQAKTEEEVVRLQNYINFQWLTPEENLRKHDSPTEEGVFLCRFLLGREWIYD